MGRESQAQETRNGARLETAPFFIGRRTPVERNAEQTSVVGRNAGRTPLNEPPKTVAGRTSLDEPPGKRTPNVEKPT
ncbi:MAG: hypothetical protein IJY15_00340 [Thermoguttaceae bacterium]|nr:hypothetical protein [Thermoguttaceae bacterium]